jgi:hypothetical protein
MRKPPTRLILDEESHQAARERPEAKQALDSLARLIVESFVKTIPPDEAAALGRRLKTKEGGPRLATNPSSRLSCLEHPMILIIETAQVCRGAVDL